MILVGLGLLTISLPPSLAHDGLFMDIEFEPMQGPAMLHGGALPLDATNLKKVDLDRALENLLGGATNMKSEDLDRGLKDLLGGATFGDQQGPFRPARSRSATHKPRDIGLSLLQGFPADLQKSSMPVGLFRDLFPGPLVMQQHHGARRATPFANPDPLVMDMIQTMNNDIQDSLLPLIHDTQPLTSTPLSCYRDVQKHCRKDRSQVHCLGQHEDDISESCGKELSQSVPFICSRAIDKFCGVLPIGVLDCLGGHLEDLEAPCKDAVVATKHVIAKVNTQKATVTMGETKNGVKTIHAPPRSLSLPRAAAGENTASDSSADIAVPLPEKSASRKVLDSAAALVAEAEEAAKRRQQQLEAIFGQLHAESWSTPWMILVLGFCAALVYIAMNFSESSGRLSRKFRPCMSTEDASCTPLIGLQEPKKTASFGIQ
jgi:hypothetical protein